MERKRCMVYFFKEVQDHPNLEYVMLDATITRAHACAAGYFKDSAYAQALRRSRGGFSIKIHVLVDALGNPLKFILIVGRYHEITKVPDLIEGIEKSFVIADKGYDSNAFIH